MLRSLVPYLWALPAIGLQAQDAQPAAPVVPMSITRSVSVPMNAVQLFDAATQAWTWTFGKEPGAKLLRSDREQGVIEGLARMNYRSTMLSLREETMGTVQYRIRVEIKAGECRVVLNELVHTGNRSTARGGVDMGLLVQAEHPTEKVRGTGRANAVRIYADLKGQTQTHLGALMNNFCSRLRAMGPE